VKHPIVWPRKGIEPQSLGLPGNALVSADVVIYAGIIFIVLGAEDGHLANPGLKEFLVLQNNPGTGKMNSNESAALVVFSFVLTLCSWRGLLHFAGGGRPFGI